MKLAQIIGLVSLSAIGTLIADTTSPEPTNPSAARSGPVEKIPFASSQQIFKQNPYPGDIKLPPMPDALSPLGPSKPKVMADGDKSDKLNGARDSVIVDLPARAVVEVEQPATKTAGGTAENNTQVTVSPFLQWIRQTKEAGDIARAQRETYNTTELNKKAAQDSVNNDLFLNIRYPYVGSQDQPPGGGAVIYSVPQH